MRNKLLYLTLFAATAILCSCDKDTEGMTWITSYPTLEILGDEEVVLYVGDSFADDGCYAELEGEDVSDQIITTSDLDVSDVGTYSVSYIIYNSDGFSASASRTIYVVDPTSVATIYWAEVENSYNGAHYYDAPINITDNGNGTYQIDDVLGGYYFNGVYPGYEPSYDFHAEMNISVADDGTVTQVGTVGSWYWDDEDLEIVSGYYDSSTGIITLSILFSDMDMSVTLRPITK
ncbi:MAG: DUF5011 domain-containing protein [Prevotellaceae bacterium]|nr:DUF5011 domain-containing protein [Prevotellaceae bacterium]